MAINSNNPLLQAAINRLSARLSDGLIETAARIAIFSKDAPRRLRKEWKLFQEEIIIEAERLEKNSNQSDGEGISSNKKDDIYESSQEKIDRLRAKVTELNQKIEGFR